MAFSLEPTSSGFPRFSFEKYSRMKRGSEGFLFEWDSRSDGNSKFLRWLGGKSELGRDWSWERRWGMWEGSEWLANTPFIDILNRLWCFYRIETWEVEGGTTFTDTPSTKWSIHDSMSMAKKDSQSDSEAWSLNYPTPRWLLLCLSSMKYEPFTSISQHHLRYNGSQAAGSQRLRRGLCQCAPHIRGKNQRECTPPLNKKDPQKPLPGYAYIR